MSVQTNLVRVTMSGRSRFILSRDIILITLLNFLVLYGLHKIALNVSALNPLEQALEDSEGSDLYYWLSRHYNNDKKNIQKTDPEIVIINEREADRGQIESLLKKINTYHPMAIGLDMSFDKVFDSTDILNRLKTEQLDSTFKNSPNTVIGMAFKYSKEDFEKADSPFTSQGFILRSVKELREHVKEGFMNLPSGNEYSTNRNFVNFIKHKNSFYPSFAYQVASLSKTATAEWEENDTSTHRIAYNADMDFMKLDREEVMNLPEKNELLKNKIILIGYLGPGKNYADLNDNHFTPLNPRYIGRTYPDMYGVEIHAHIIQTIRHNRHFTEISSWVSYLITVILSFIFTAILLRFYSRKPQWYHLLAVAIEFFLLAMSMFMVILLHHFNLELDIHPIIYPMLLLPTVLYFYDLILKLINKKWKFDSVILHH